MTLNGHFTFVTMEHLITIILYILRTNSIVLFCYVLAVLYYQVNVVQRTQTQAYCLNVRHNLLNN